MKKLSSIWREVGEFSFIILLRSVLSKINCFLKLKKTFCLHSQLEKFSPAVKYSCCGVHMIQQTNLVNFLIWQLQYSEKVLKGDFFSKICLTSLIIHKKLGFWSL